MRISDDRDEDDVLNASYVGKVVVLGLGNPYMRDDGVGIRVAEELKKRSLGEGVVVFESRSFDASLFWQFRNAAALVIVDALRSGAPSGSVSRFSLAPSKAPVTGIPSLHELQLHDLVDLAGLDVLYCPVTVVAIEPKDCSLGEGLTQNLRTAVPRAVEEVTKVLSEVSSKRGTRDA
jgi:hydrogenase maturation protease